MSKLCVAVLVILGMVASSEAQNVPGCLYNDDLVPGFCNGTITTSYVCDGVDDCYEAPKSGITPKDETFCTQHTCTPRLQFDCGNLYGQCIPLSFKCNGEVECEGIGADGGKDEKDCPDDILCTIHESWGSTNVGSSQRCDGTKDCPNGEDEDNCAEYTCDTRVQLKCGDNTCRPLWRQCDCVNDCPGGEDEVNCGVYTFPPYPVEKHRKNKPGQTLLNSISHVIKQKIKKNRKNQG